MRAHKDKADLVFRGRVGPWYGALSGVVTFAAAALALQPGMPTAVPVLLLVTGTALLWPTLVRNRVELYPERLEIVFGWGRAAIPYDHVRGVRRLDGKLVGQPAMHDCAASLDVVFIEAPRDGDAVVSVTDNDALAAELRRRAGLE